MAVCIYAVYYCLNAGSGFEKFLIKKIETIHSELNQQNLLLLTIFHHINKENTNERLPVVPALPIDNNDDLQTWEDYLAEEQNVKTAIVVLKTTTVDGIESSTRRVLRRIISSAYAQNFNWAGREPKRAFKSLRICTLVVAVIRSCFPEAKENTIESCIKSWLKYAPLRLCQNKKKAKPLNDDSLMPTTE